MTFWIQDQGAHENENEDEIYLRIMTRCYSEACCADEEKKKYNPPVSRITPAAYYYT